MNTENAMEPVTEKDTATSDDDYDKLALVHMCKGEYKSRKIPRKVCGKTSIESGNRIWNHEKTI